MDIALFWSLFAVLGIAMFAIAMRASKNLESDEDFFYGQRKFGIFAVTMSLSAVHIGGGIVLGLPIETYRFGFYGIAYALGISLGFLVLGLGVAHKLRRENLKTVAELFSKKYDSEKLRRVASLMSIITLSGILAAQIIASRKLLGFVVGEHQWILIFFWLLLIAYTMFGGLRAVIATEIFQIVFVIAVFVGLFAFYLSERDLAVQFPLSFHDLNASPDFFSRPPWDQCLVLFLMPFFYAFLAQDLGQRLFSARTPWVASISSILAGVIVLSFSLIPVLVGMEARLVGVFSEEEYNPVFSILAVNVEPFFYYLLICGVIAAISSTADGILCAIGSNVVEDFTPPKHRNHQDKTMSLMFSRGAVLIIGILALFVAYSFDEILGLLSLSYEISIASLFVPVIFALICRAPKKEAAALAMAFGFVSFIILKFLRTEIPGALLSIGLSLLGFIIGTVYSRARSCKLR